LSKAPLITIVSDWKSSDYYLGVLRGILASACPDTRLVDISNSVKTFDIAQAAFILRSSFHFFPAGTIHLLAIDSEPNSEYKPVIVEAFGHYFVGTDTGVFDLIFEGEQEAVFEIQYPDNEIITFPEANIFMRALVGLCRGKKASELGKNRNRKLFKRMPLSPTFDRKMLLGRIIHLDSYKNAISNISQTVFEQQRNGRKYTIYIQSQKNKITQISTGYRQVADGEIFALFNTAGLLEIGINKGSAVDLLGLNTNSTIRIDFHDN